MTGWNLWDGPLWWIYVGLICMAKLGPQVVVDKWLEILTMRSASAMFLDHWCYSLWYILIDATWIFIADVFILRCLLHYLLVLYGYMDCLSPCIRQFVGHSVIIQGCLPWKITMLPVFLSVWFLQWMEVSEGCCFFFLGGGGMGFVGYLLIEIISCGFIEFCSVFHFGYLVHDLFIVYFVSWIPLPHHSTKERTMSLFIISL